MRILESFRGLYIDLSGLSWNEIDSERSRFRSCHPFLLPDARFIYSELTNWKPPTQGEYDRRERERAQLRTPIGEKDQDMRYAEESTNRENPLRVGTKRIKVKGIQYPFIAVSDHWRPALLHESRLVWVHYYRPIKGLRAGTFRVYYATVKVPFNRLPWTVDNDSDGIDYRSLEESIQAAMKIVQVKEVMAEVGRRGGLAKSEVKAGASRENGKMGGRRKQFSALDMEEENQE